MEQRERLAEWWPLFGLSIRTPRLELRYPDDDDLLVLARLTEDIHDPGLRRFSVGWHEVPSPQRERNLLQYHWGRRGDWSADAWRLELVTVVDGQVVGTQGVWGNAYRVSRTVMTGSWLGRAHQGQGIGTEMRAAVLHLAFAGLAADRADTGAFEDNEPSLAVTRKLGYRPNGDALVVDKERRDRELLFTMDRAGWEPIRRDDIEIVGLEPCLPLFGLSEG
jgi:RimJ/RimL family protein N-acetyltransferase